MNSEIRDILNAPVVCVGVNPAFDLTCTLSGLDGNRVNLVTDEYCEAAGKAANVACALAENGIAAALTGLYGEENLAEWKALFDRRSCGKVPLKAVTCPGATRQNLTLLAGGQTYKINRPGCAAVKEAVDQLDDAINAFPGEGRIAVFTGSLPEGLPLFRYVEMMHRAKNNGYRVAVDSSALPLEVLVPLQPWIYKPNAYEIAALSGLDPNNDDLLIEQARLLADSGTETVLLTLGERGLAAVTTQRVIRVNPLPVKVINTVGAGDAALAAYIAASCKGESPEECARKAARAGELAVSKSY